jgi:hypothetical protein
VWSNHNATAVDERAPSGGFNASGIGRELGRPGMHEFTEIHVMAVPSGGLAPSRGGGRGRGGWFAGPFGRNDLFS